MGFQLSGSRRAAFEQSDNYYAPRAFWKRAAVKCQDRGKRIGILSQNAGVIGVDDVRVNHAISEARIWSFQRDGIAGSKLV